MKLRSIRLGMALLAVALVGTAPRAFADGSAAPEKKETKPAPVDFGALFRIHYDNRVRSFREQNQTFQNVVLLGDSITEGFEVPKYFPGRRVLNRGIGGDVIGNALPADDPRGVLRRLDSSVYDCGATDLFLMIGINDLNSGRSVDQVEAGYREILKQLRAHSPMLRVYVESLLPTRGNYAMRNSQIVDVNQRLEKLAAEYHCTYLDLHRLLIDDKGELKEGVTQDGLHLTEPGYHMWRIEIGKLLHWSGQD